MKETLNTFSEGLVKDYNEMVSPKTTMSNCLNGTLITYNGNEFTLQNDMGNVKLDNVKLPEGYIPVGIAEHGGIVYVAAYNPNTKKWEYEYIHNMGSSTVIWTVNNAETNKKALGGCRDVNSNKTIVYTLVNQNVNVIGNKGYFGGLT